MDRAALLKEDTMAVRPVPEGFHTVTPYLVVKDAAALVDFMQRAFGARDAQVARTPDGVVVHADVIIGDSHVMVGQAGGSNPPFPGMIYLYVPDCDATYAQSLKAGGTSLQPVATQFYGDRHGAVNDPWGNQWWIATHVEDVGPDELERRMKTARPVAATS
jgi:PhnB protein